MGSAAGGGGGVSAGPFHIGCRPTAVICPAVAGDDKYCRSAAAMAVRQPPPPAARRRPPPLAARHRPARPVIWSNWSFVSINAAIADMWLASSRLFIWAPQLMTAAARPVIGESSRTAPARRPGRHRRRGLGRGRE